MQDVRVADRCGHLQVDAERAQRAVRVGEFRGRPVRAHAGLVTRGAEAVHLDVDEAAQLANQELDVDAGAPVHLGGYSRLRIATRMARP